MAVKGRHHQNILLSFPLIIVFTGISYAQTNKLLQGQLLKDGDVLVSAYGNFKLGFFSPDQYTRERYLGIWYDKPRDRTLRPYFGEPIRPRPVWIANSNSPILSNESPRLTIDNTDGNLKILRDGGSPIPISLVPRAGNNNTGAFLLKNGNFVLYEMNSNGSISQELWQSFDYPTDTLLPGMKLGFNLQTGKEWFLRSRESYSSPAEGYYKLGIDPNISNILIIWENNKVYWKSGLLQNESLNDYFSKFTYKFGYKFNYTSNERETYLTYSVKNVVTSFPLLRIIGSDTKMLTDDRDVDILCFFGACQKSSGCQSSYGSFEQRTGSMDAEGFEFKQSDGYILTCEEKCLTNCSCVAYATTETSNGTLSCQIWSKGTNFLESPRDKSAREIFLFIENNGAEMQGWQWLIFSVVAALILCLLLFLGYLERRRNKAKVEKWWMSLIVVVGLASVAPLFCYWPFLLLKKLKAKVENRINRQKLLRELGDNNRSLEDKDQSTKRDLKIFDFQTVVAATDNFSAANRLGQGGFGPVYKGKLLDGQEVAIKRLSKSSGQGIVEFKNEAKLIAKLQHTNLVRLLGCSLQGGERLLVYEYLPNKSLDFFIFDSSRKPLLNWKKRFDIIEGIAQGLLYLHKYSRLRVIHRDLKASNILLDEQMNPKISDFGMAKTFSMDELEANTNRIVGTHGYMSPEYVLNGIVSMKSDVYSFGVLVLEIITSKKNNSCYDAERPLNLVGYAWKLWTEGKGLELTDKTMDESCSPEEVLRCIHVGLLCVQDRATDRPTMSDVVSMLTNDSMALPAPKQPAFFINVASDQVPEVTEIKLELCSANDVTISEMEPRS
ncbi:putative Receptor protein kinase [Melia azedarach]|uniref:Receptor protein kinase n=1 Tax=Melia azedarach TaxID=155640 RepID=A0ACC1Y4L1_MELAZ|nr:putative Receptor protein kinase [Melia azedarach]